MEAHRKVPRHPLFIYLSVYLSIYISIYLPIQAEEEAAKADKLSKMPSYLDNANSKIAQQVKQFWDFNYITIFLIFLSYHLSIHLFIYQSFFPSNSLVIYLCIYLSIFLASQSFSLIPSIIYACFSIIYECFSIIYDCFSIIYDCSFLFLFLFKI